MNLKESIKCQRVRLGLSQKDLGDKLGLSSQAISMYERGERTPEPDTILKMADIFQVDLNVLFGRNAKKGVRIPVLGYVAAGIPIEAITDIIDYEEIEADMLADGSEYFALQIRGESMAPRINNGDVVIVRRQPDVDSGQIAIVCINGDEATCKKIIKQEGGILLQPLNQAYTPSYFTNEQIESIPVTIFGRVVELRAKF
ncbi:MAG: helix-turn-helix domain-containing protein [Clostridia bacterium]|nr:helix-turn-helix domain-containing protein [Clostridia bacterium]